MRKRQWIAAIMAGAMVCSSLTACGGGSKPAENQGGGDQNATTAAGFRFRPDIRRRGFR